MKGIRLRVKEFGLLAGHSSWDCSSCRRWQCKNELLTSQHCAHSWMSMEQHQQDKKETQQQKQEEEEEEEAQRASSQWRPSAVGASAVVAVFQKLKSCSFVPLPRAPLLG